MTCESTGVNGDKSLLALPSELLVRIALELVPPGCFSRTAAEWTHLVRLAATCTVLHGAVGEALQSEVRALRSVTPLASHAKTGWLLLISRLARVGESLNSSDSGGGSRSGGDAGEEGREDCKAVNAVDAGSHVVEVLDKNVGCSGGGAGGNSGGDGCGDGVNGSPDAKVDSGSIDRVGGEGVKCQNGDVGLERRWCKVGALRAVRPQQPGLTPLTCAPRLSGASLTPVSAGRLVLFGGRCSATSETFGATRVATVSWSGVARAVAQWDALLIEGEAPCARCYHGAAGWPRDGELVTAGTAGTCGHIGVCVPDGIGAHLGGMVEQQVIIFGGAGDGNVLYDDVWCLERYVKHGADGSAGVGSGRAQSPSAHAGKSTRREAWRWRQMVVGDAPRPAARSSHVCCRWHSADGEALVVHGGMGHDGVRADVWVLRQTENGACKAAYTVEWTQLSTLNKVERAHHCGGVVRDKLIVHSGQDANLLTISSVCVLDLVGCAWETVRLARDGPAARIDGCAAVVDDVGIVVLGGVGTNFNFLPSNETWLVTTADRQQRVRETGEDGPCGRACQSMCADGLHVYCFGGFDGEQDLDDLWCLSLAPSYFRHASQPIQRKVMGSHREFEMAEFRARQARQASALHATPSAAGHNSLHYLVASAAFELLVDKQAPHAATAGSNALPSAVATAT